MQILTIETPSLGDRSYIVSDGATAAVIDPQRDIDRVLALLDQHGLELVAVLETHLHNDYLSGGLELSRRTGARYHLGADEQLDFPFTPLRDGEQVQVGELSLRALLTPGHTPTHLSYVAVSNGRERAVFTGGSLLFGSVGRTDLVAGERTEELTRLQHRSVRRIVSELADDVEVRPTHGFGSFCSSGEISAVERSTIGWQRRDNQALTMADEESFVRLLIAGLDDYPAYYARMGPLNRRGPAPVDLSPPRRLGAAEVQRRLHAREWVVDLRDRRKFAADHLAGSINIELSDEAATYVGWLMPWGTPVTLVADSAQDTAQMQRQLVRIGIDRPAGQVPDGLDALTAAMPRETYEVSDFAGLRRTLDGGDDAVVLDTRRDLEWARGHLSMAVHIPLHELQERLDEVPAGTVWVHCASGYRSSIAASMLARAGREVVLIDDDFQRSAARHLSVTGAAG